jgi:ubiquinone/menaquinone biosynthesis C-methylase UbiE
LSFPPHTCADEFNKSSGGRCWKRALRLSGKSNFSLLYRCPFAYTHRMLRRSSAILLALCGLGAALGRAQDTSQQEAERLAASLYWQPGNVVAEIGAGKGQLTLAAAQRVGSRGKVYSTELDPEALAHLKELATKEKNIIAVKAAESDTNLPPTCCDSIFMRLVYHHLTKPADIDASLFRSLKPGGRLAVIDEEPSKGSTIPEGVPKNRIGHGVPQNILISELVSAGLEVDTIMNDWPHDEFHQLYCVVFRKKKP